MVVMMIMMMMMMMMMTGSDGDDCWSQEDDQITAQYQTIRKIKDRDTISQVILASHWSVEHNTDL